MYDKRYAIFVLRDKHGRILLQHRDSAAPILPNHWGFFGGAIEEGESPKDAVRRQAREELNIAAIFEFFGRYEIREDSGFNEKFLFVADLKESLEELRKRQREGDDLGMFMYEDISRLKISQGDMIIIKDLFKRLDESGVLEVEKGK